MKKRILYIGNKLSIHGYTSTSIETLGHFFEEEGFEVFYASSKKNKILRLLDMMFTTISKSKKVDFVLIDTYSTQNFWYALIVSQLCRILNLKYIAKLHGGDLPNRLKKSAYYSNLIFENAFKITAPSYYLYNIFKEMYSKNLIYIPNTIELNNYIFSDKKYDEPKLLWVRSFSKIYNPKMAIKVFAELKRNYPNSLLCMVGPDKENIIEECKSYAKSLNVDVEFTGILSKPEWIELSKNYNIFMNTTHFDNTPISVIEAMALGLPVVSTNVGGIPFLLSDKKNALLVNDDDAKAMQNAIELLMNDAVLRSELIKNARSLVEDFDWNNVKQKWLELLN